MTDRGCVHFQMLSSLPNLFAAQHHIIHDGSSIPAPRPRPRAGHHLLVQQAITMLAG
jgi:hypothetical protein